MFKIGSRFLVMDDSCPGLLDWIGIRVGVKEWSKTRAFGLLDPDRGVIAGVAYNKFVGHDVMMHAAALSGSGWLSKTFLWAVFDYPFNTLKCRRITASCSVENREAFRLLTGTGFKQEGVVRQGDSSGADLQVFGMLRDECPWLAFREKALKEIGYAQDKAA